MHPNSLIAYQEEARKFNDREKMIYGHLTMTHAPITDREVKDYLFGKAGDMNNVRPRITDLIEKKWVIEVDKIRDYVTGKSVRRVRAISPEERVDLEANQPFQQALL